MNEKIENLQKILYSFMANNDEGMLLSDTSGNIHWANKKACSIFGLTEEQITELKTNFLGLFPNDRTGTDSVYADGKLIAKRHSFNTVEIDGSTWHLIKIFDISAFDSLSTEQNRQSINTPVNKDTAAVNVWSIDADYRYTFFNDNHKKAMKEVWGAEISLGSDILDYLKKSDYKKQVENNYDQMLRGENHRSVDHFTMPEGDSRYYENFGHPIRNIRGEIIGIMFYTVDITEKMEIENRLKLSVSLLESIINSPEDLHILSIDKEYRYLFFNNAHSLSMQEIWNTRPEIGRNIFEILPDSEHSKRVKSFYDRSFNGEVLSDISEIPGKNGESLFYNNISAPIKDSAGNITGITVFILNITDRLLAEKKTSESLIEKEILLKEIHHRVKNNIQLITSMINLQLDLVEDKTARRILQDSLSRINTMGLIHQALYQGDNLAKIQIEGYCSNLLNSIRDFYQSESRKIAFKTEFNDISLEIAQAIPIGLIINETVTNSMKYAFSGRDEGLIQIRMALSENNRIHLQISDNGVGMAENYSPGESKTLGMKLLKVFAMQLKGTIDFTSNQGLTVDIFFKPT